MSPVATKEPETRVDGEEEREETAAAGTEDNHDDLAPDFGDEAKLFCTDGYTVGATKLCLGAINCEGDNDDELIVGSTVKVRGLNELEVKSVKYDDEGTRFVVLYAKDFEIV